MRKTKNTIKKVAEKLSQKAENIVIEHPKTFRVALEVEGTAPLIQNKFSQKTIEMMLRKHMGISVQKEKKRPRELIEGAIIRNIDERVCIPPQAFKATMITASGMLKGLKKNQLKTHIFVVGQSIPITYAEDMVPRMDAVWLAGPRRVPDVRFRPMFEGWKARMVIEYSDLLSVNTIIDLLHRGGSVGVGEWRPERNGTFGTFRVLRQITSPKEIAEVLQECSSPMPRPIIPDWALDLDISPEDLRKAFDEISGGSNQDEEVEPKKVAR